MLEIDIKPSDALARKIANLQQSQAMLQSRMSEIVRESAFEVVAYATDMVPVSTGALRRSIKPSFFAGGLAAVIGSYLPYAARQEYDMTLDHSYRPTPVRRKNNTKAGKRGSIIKGRTQSNPNAQWGFMRKALAKVKPTFLFRLQMLVADLGRGLEE